MPREILNQILLTCFCLFSFIFIEKALAEEQGASTDAGVILFLGDSLTAGYGIAPEDSYPSLLSERIKNANPQLRVVNAGVSGDTTAGGLRRLDWLLRQKVSILVLALGANDGLRGIPLSETKENLLAMIKKTSKRYPKSEIVLAGMLIPPNMGENYSSEFQSLFPEIAKEQNIPLIPFLLDGVAAEPSLNLGDGIHPNEAGQKIVAENVWKVLKETTQLSKEPS